MVLTWNVAYPAYTGRENRRVYIYLPRGYEYEQSGHYPVLYMFDGHNLFFDADATYGKSWGVGKYLDECGRGLIVVGLECNHGEGFARLSEYSPFDFDSPETGAITGRGRETMDWIVRRLKPRIDRSFRTLPDRAHTFIGGSSMGGLMALYALLQYNRRFSRAAALSPSLEIDFDALRALTRTARIGAGTVLYMDYGSGELERMGEAVDAYADLSAELIDRGVYLTSRIVPGGEHCEASWERQLPFALGTLLYGL